MIAMAKISLFGNFSEAVDEPVPSLVIENHVGYVLGVSASSRKWVQQTVIAGRIHVDWNIFEHDCRTQYSCQLYRYYGTRQKSAPEITGQPDAVESDRQ